jgi:hypothetical protein
MDKFLIRKRKVDPPAVSENTQPSTSKGGPSKSSKVANIEKNKGSPAPQLLPQPSTDKGNLQRENHPPYEAFCLNGG